MWSAGEHHVTALLAGAELFVGLYLLVGNALCCQMSKLGFRKIEEMLSFPVVIF